MIVDEWEYYLSRLSADTFGNEIILRVCPGVLLVQQINNSVAVSNLMTTSQFSQHVVIKPMSNLLGSQKHGFLILDVLYPFGQAEHDAALSPTRTWT